MSQAVTDKDLIKRIAARDEAAVQALFARYHVRLYRFILRLVRNEAVAEELTNEVFLEIWRHANRYEGRSSPSTWIFAIAHNRTVSVLRKRTEDQLDENSALETADTSDDPEIVTQKTDKGEKIRECINQLSAEHREVVDLVYYHEKSVREVSEIVGIPEATVKTRMFYARKQLSELLKKAGIDRGWP